MIVHYGFMQSPDIPIALKFCGELKLIPDLDPDSIAYYADRASLVVADNAEIMQPWQKWLYSFMARNSQRAIDFYNLTPERSVELGIQVVI